VTHHVRASLRSGEIGAHYVRPYEFAGEQLVLRYPMNTADGERWTRVLVWRRGERFWRCVQQKTSSITYIKCFSEFDLEGILSDYAPDAVFFTPEGPLKGVDAIRSLYEALFAEFRKPGMTIEMKRLSGEGDHAYALWTAETADNVYELGADTQTIRDGKIVMQSFAAKIVPRG